MVGRRVEDRAEVDAVDPQVGEVVEVLDHAAQVAAEEVTPQRGILRALAPAPELRLVTVNAFHQAVGGWIAIGEAIRENLVDDHALRPLGGHSRRVVDRDLEGMLLVFAVDRLDLAFDLPDFEQRRLRFITAGKLEAIGQDRRLRRDLQRRRPLPRRPGRQQIEVPAQRLALLGDAPRVGDHRLRLQRRVLDHQFADRAERLRSRRQMKRPFRAQTFGSLAADR